MQDGDQFKSELAVLYLVQSGPVKELTEEQNEQAEAQPGEGAAGAAIMMRLGLDYQGTYDIPFSGRVTFPPPAR